MPPVADYLRRVRKAVPDLQNVSPTEVCGRIDATGRLTLGTLRPDDAVALATSAAREGVILERTDVSSTGYLPMDRTVGSILLIKDFDGTDRTIDEMLTEGVPIEDMDGKEEDAT